MSRLHGGLAALVAAVVVLTGCTSPVAGAGGSTGARAGAASTPSGPSCLPPPTSSGAATTSSGAATTSSGAATAASGAATAASGAATAGPDAATAAPDAATAAPKTAGSHLRPSLDLTLPCFVGGQPVRLANLGTPAVINLWASWCAPCRTELPEMQRFADRTAGRVQVVGVITSDPNRGGAQSLVDDLGLRFPMLYDEQGKLQARIGPPVAMPTTLLVDADGRVAYRHSARPLDEAALADLVRDHLRVAA